MCVYISLVIYIMMSIELVTEKFVGDSKSDYGIGTILTATYF